MVQPTKPEADQDPDHAKRRRDEFLRDRMPQGTDPRAPDAKAPDAKPDPRNDEPPAKATG